MTQRFDAGSGRFTLTIDADPARSPSLVYAPRCHYPGGPIVSVTDGRVTAAGEQLLAWTCDAAGQQTLTLERLAGAMECE